jgi:hypothetical protein
MASAGGQARAQVLPAHRRSEIARAGYQAMVQKWFKGDYSKAKNWLVKKGQFVTDAAPWNGVFCDPGPHPAHADAEATR